MKKIIFFGTPAYGHMICVAPVIKKIVESGIHVTWLTSKKYEYLVKDSGATFEEYIINFDEFNLNEVTSNFFELFKNLTSLNQQAYLMYKDYNFKDTYILYDSMCSFAKNIAKSKNIKAICLVTTMVFNIPVFLTSNLAISSIPLYFKNLKNFNKIVKAEKIFRKKEQLDKFKMIDFFVNSGNKTIVFTPKELQPCAHTFNKTFYFVGTTIKDRSNFCKDNLFEECKWYVSLGSIFTQNKNILNKIGQLKELSNSKIVVTTGNINLKNNNKNVKFFNFTNQQEMLMHCKYFINHGGLNSVYESIYYGVPQICYPMQQEQKMYSKIVQKKHTGVYMKKIDDKYVKKLLNKKYTNNLVHMSKILREYDGTNRAFNIICSYFFN